MRKTKQLALHMCLAVPVMSAFGFAVRWMQNISIFDEETHLAAPGATTSWMLVVLSLAALVLFAARLFPLAGSPMSSHPSSDIRGDDRAYRIMALLSGFMVAFGGAMMVLGILGDDEGALRRELGILAFISGCGFIYAGYAGKSKADTPLSAFFSAVPELFACFWLIVSYRDHASNPVIWSYCVEIIAIAVAVLALHFTAGFVFCRPRTYATSLLLCMGAYACFTALGDTRPAAFQLCFAGMGLFFIATMYELIMCASASEHNAGRAPKII